MIMIYVFFLQITDLHVIIVKHLEQLFYLFIRNFRNLLEMFSVDPSNCMQGTLRGVNSAINISYCQEVHDYILQGHSSA